MPFATQGFEHSTYKLLAASLALSAALHAVWKGNGVVVGASASQSVDLGFFPLSSHTKRLLKMVSIASLLGARHLWEVVENKPASSLVVSLGKALNGMAPPLCGRQVAHKPRKRQLPSECGLPVQKSIAIQFVFS